MAVYLGENEVNLFSGQPSGVDGDNMSFGAEPLVGVAKVGQSALCEEE